MHKGTLKTAIRFATFPRTEPPPGFLPEVLAVIRRHEAAISTRALQKGLTSDRVLEILAPGLQEIGFAVEASKMRKQKIARPVFFGDDGVPTLQYQIDAYHDQWRCALEVEAGRAWRGNAVYRDLIQAMVMVGVHHLVLIVPNSYKFKSQGKPSESPDYEYAKAVADALFGHTRVKMPYSLTLVGY